MANKETIGGIIEKTLEEIIAEKGISGDEGQTLLNKSLQLVALAMAGRASVSSPEDMRRVKSAIEE
jgi:hypothetical protein